MKTTLFWKRLLLITSLALCGSDASAQQVYKLEVGNYYFTIADKNGEGPVNDPDGDRTINPRIDLVVGERVEIILTRLGGTHDWTFATWKTDEVSAKNPESSVVFEPTQTADDFYYCSVGDHREVEGMEGVLKVHKDKEAMAVAVAAYSARQTAYATELRRLPSADSIDPCQKAIFIAARDGKVRSILMRNLSNPDYVFKNVRCLEKPSIPEYEYVLFDFDCRPGIFCLIDPNVLVVTDVVNRRVVDIKDPYPFLSDPERVSNQRVSQSRAADNEISLVGTNNKRFRLGTQVNPTIRVKLGETVNVTLTSSGGTHDWTLVYVENGQEVKWADTPDTNGPAKSTGVFTANRVGTFDYFCNVSAHRADGMKGKFIVER